MEIQLEYERGFVNRGDLTRLKAAMRRAMEGRSLRIAFLGGSITQGYLATEPTKCYAALTHRWWEESFPDTKVKYINAGIGGTTSQYGVARVEADVLAKLPDVVFVEFSVNDAGEEIFRETYEGLLRRILDAKLQKGKRRWSPAVVLIHCIKYDDGATAEDIHLELGRHYALPCVSMRSTLYAGMLEGKYGSRDITKDDLHPDDTGHRLMAEVICHALNEVREEAEKEYYQKTELRDTEPLPAPLTANAYEAAVRYQNTNCEPELAGFVKDLREKQYDTDCFRGGWRATKRGDELILRFMGSELALQYRRTVRRPALIAEAVIDGDTKHAIYLDANFHEDWGDSLSITTLLRHGQIVSGQTAEGVSPADYAGQYDALARAAREHADASEHELRLRILGTPEELGYTVREQKTGGPAWLKAEEEEEPGFDLVSLIVSEPMERKQAFPDGFVWGVAASAYQVEGTDPEDGRGRCIWDDYVDRHLTADQRDAYTSCDHMHRYREDYRRMRQLGIRHYRFSISWARILPEGVGEVNPKAIAMYRDMICAMRENGITPYLTLYHWELPAALEEKGGWLNPEIVTWFGDYARVVAENFGDLCDYFITLNEPQCFTGLGYGAGVHAPAKKLPKKDVFLIIHHALKAHGQAVIQLRRYAGHKIQVGYAPTCGVALPCTESPEDIEAARRTYFGFYQPMERWAWNVSWYSDPVVLGRYPEEGLKRFKKYLPEITEEDMALIHQPIDFLGQNIYNGYPVYAGEDGEPVYAERVNGSPLTASKWPNTPGALYWGMRFLYERYRLPLYITENGVSCADNVARDGHIHDTARIEFLDAYLGQLQRAIREGVDVRGYFLWTFLDNFEWDKGYSERFGIVWVDFGTQQRIVKDSALWYQQVIRTNGQILSDNAHPRCLLRLKPQLVSKLWGGARLKTEWGYESEQESGIGECWAVSANSTADSIVADGYYAGRTLSELWREEPQLFGYPEGAEFPLLVKLIDAREDLSIQVHPDDKYALEHEGCRGKRECWYILDCPEDARLIVGNRAGSREELRALVESGRWEELLNYITVQPGDFIQIEPGTLHAITSGTLLLEVQQNSDVTYRVYDYDRCENGKPRELHLAKSLDVIRTPDDAVQIIHSRPEVNTLRELIATASYRIWTIRVEEVVTLPAHRFGFLIASVIEGEGLLDGQPVKKGDMLIVPCGYPALVLSGSMRVNFAAPR